MFIDTHAHLNYPDIQSDIENILSRARDNGVEKIIVPATNYRTSLEVIELISKHEMLYGAVGIHPTELKDFEDNHLYQIEELSKSDKIVAIGEIGLDYYWKPFDAEKQKYIITAQFQIAKRVNLPVIIHNRESTGDLMKIVNDEYDNGKLRGQFHSFSADLETAKQCVEMGFYISFTGNITYKPNDKTLISYELVRQTPLQNILLETDSPYIPPVPYRGKQNEPSYIIHTAGKIAELKQIAREELGNITSSNVKNLFKI